MKTLLAWLFVGVAALLFVIFPALIVINGYDDLLLLVRAEEATAEVVEAEQGKPFLMRQGDWRISYRFAVDERKFEHQDILPPAEKFPDQKVVLIKYFPPHPQISRIASQVSFTPVAAAVILGAALWGLIQSLRGDNPAPGKKGKGVNDAAATDPGESR